MTCTSGARTSSRIATKRIDWDLPVNPCNVMETPDEINPIYGSRQWEVLSQAERDELGHHLGAWLATIAAITRNIQAKLSTRLVHGAG